MKAIEILDWICNESIEGEFLGIVNVPVWWEQSEEWWLQEFGGVPPYAIGEGKYLYYYTSQIPDEVCYAGCYIEPDAEIELSTEDGFDFINLYKVED